jgi:hypothetical protein
MPAHIALVGLPHASPKRIKVVKKPLLKLLFILLLSFFFPHIKNEVPVPGRHGETNSGGAKEILFLVSFLN